MECRRQTMPLQLPHESRTAAAHEGQRYTSHERPQNTAVHESIRLQQTHTFTLNAPTAPRVYDRSAIGSYARADRRQLK
jgi:hypothetical protein